MNCPTCKTENLVISERKGIEIDYCPKCRGIWLDRGELDKMLERAREEEGQRDERRDNNQQPPYPQQHPGGHHQQPYGGHYGKPYKKRKSFLEELFD